MRRLSQKENEGAVMQQELERITRVIGEGPYRDDWESLAGMEMPAWFGREKFGIFIHWGLYSIPAHNNEWYSRNMYIRNKEEWEYHRRTYGDHTVFGYKDFIPLFRAEKFCPDEWAELIKASGARYVFPVAEHHDGFQMYKSRISCWNAYEMGPRRDILGELKEAVKAQGLHFCTSSHRAEHWFFMGHGKEFPSDVKEPLRRGDFYWPAMEEPDNQSLQSQPYPDEEFLQDWLLRTCELIDHYQPELLYFDWWIQHEAFKPYLKRVAAYYYNRGKAWGMPAAICYKHDAMMFGSGIPEVERGTFREPKPYLWQTDTSIARNSWCYTDTLEYRTAEEILRLLIEAVSKNGNMLLNIGPRGDGSIPETDQKILRGIGAWLKVNGEAVYHSRVWRVSAEGPTQAAEGQFADMKPLRYTEQDFRFTARGDSVYVFVMRYPQSGCLTVRSLRDARDQNLPEFHGLIKHVSLLGERENISWHTDGDGLHVKIPLRQQTLPAVLRVKMK